MKPRLKISFSGGKTSALMTYLILHHLKDKYDIIIVFANTGQENEETLIFINNCDKYFGFKTVWVEAVTNHGERKAASHRVVTFETASRNGEPFEDMIRKYGLPNQTFKNCTRELKLNAMNSYLESVGWEKGSYQTAIGIRTDEKRRVSKTADVQNIVYPLVDWFPTDKQDVNDWWEDQEFNLNLLEHQGNCKWCYKKSDRKLYRLVHESPEIFDFPRRMEQQYGTAGARKEGTPEQRFIFRGNRTTDQLIEQARIFWIKPEGGSVNDLDANGGCTESCEIYEMENN